MDRPQMQYLTKDETWADAQYLCTLNGWQEIYKYTYREHDCLAYRDLRRENGNFREKPRQWRVWVSVDTDESGAAMPFPTSTWRKPNRGMLAGRWVTLTEGEIEDEKG